MASKLKTKCVNVGEHMYEYNSDFILYPFVYFEIPVSCENELMAVAREIEKRCKERFKTAELVGIKIFKRWCDRFDVRVNFTVSDKERIDYQKWRFAMTNDNEKEVKNDAE